MTLYSRETGSGSQTLVLLHGFGGTHAIWGAIARALADRASILLYDLPGYGGSIGYPEAGSAKVAAQAVIADLKARNIERAHIAGHSMGGAVAALVGLFEPQRVASLTLLSPGGFGPDINHRLLTRYAAAENRDALVACLEAMYGWYSPIAENAIAQALATRALDGQADMLKKIAAGMVRDGRQGQLPLNRVAGLDMPISVLWGGLDNVLPVRQAQALPERFNVRVLPDVGHMLLQEAPDAVIELIRETAGL